MKARESETKSQHEIELGGKIRTRRASERERERTFLALLSKRWQ